MHYHTKHVKFLPRPFMRGLLAETCPIGVLIFRSLPSEHASWLTDTIFCLVRCYKAPLCSTVSPTGPRECDAVIFGNVVSENKAAMWGVGCVSGGLTVV